MGCTVHAFTLAISSTFAWTEKFYNMWCTHFSRLRKLKSSSSISHLLTCRCESAFSQAPLATSGFFSIFSLITSESVHTPSISKSSVATGASFYISSFVVKLRSRHVTGTVTKVISHVNTLINIQVTHPEIKV